MKTYHIIIIALTPGSNGFCSPPLSLLLSSQTVIVEYRGTREGALDAVSGRALEDWDREVVVDGRILSATDLSPLLIAGDGGIL
jgi:hypothetical protein